MEGEGDDVRPVSPQEGNLDQNLEGEDRCQLDHVGRDQVQDQEQVPILGDEIEHSRDINEPITSTQGNIKVKEINASKKVKGERADSSSCKTYDVKKFEEASRTIHGLGDIVWCKTGASPYYPAVVVNDPFLKFCTKIVMSERSPSSESPTSTSPCRQYHVQMIGDNRMLWAQDKNCISYNGMAEYEQLAMQNAHNSKAFKPKHDRLSAWKQCIATADDLMCLDKSDRIRRMESFRLNANKPFMKSPVKNVCAIRSADNSLLQNIENDSIKIKITTLPPSPSVPLLLNQDNLDSRKEVHKAKVTYTKKKYNRCEKVKKIDTFKQEKVNTSKQDTESEIKSPSATFLPIFHSNVKFEKSFKIKKDSDIKEEKDKIEVDMKSSVDSDVAVLNKIRKKNEGKVSKSAEIKKEITNEAQLNNEVKERKKKIKTNVKGEYSQKQDSDEKDLQPSKEKDDHMPNVVDSVTGDEIGNITTDEVKQDPAHKVDHNHTDQVDKAVDMGNDKDSDTTFTPKEGSLVWALMRGYPLWPAIVSRDPFSGQFVKISDNGNKSTKRFHVLFLEYGNQRAWISSASTKPFKGLEDFYHEKDKASKKARADYEPNKRFINAFRKATDYAEELKTLSDEDRLERVLLNYGWNLVEERQTSSEGRPDKTEVVMNQSPDNEKDAVMYSPDTSSNSGLPQSRRSSGGGEAESKIDPSIDDEPVISSPEKTDEEKDLGLETPKLTKTKKRKQTNENSVNRQKVKQPKLETEDSNKKIRAEEESNFPEVGDLVWGRMSGFPWWPSFVTRNPEKLFKKQTANGKLMYHVQFFGWNDESGWVSSVMKFDGWDAFKTLKAKKKSDKSFSPGKGAQQRKWEKAVKEAEDTMTMTRQERIDQYLVSYAHKLESPQTTVTPKTPKSQVAKKLVVKTPTSSKGSGSKTPVVSKTTTPVKNYHGSNKRMSVPEGWLSKTVTREGKAHVIYVSPEGNEFPSKAAMYREISGKQETEVDGVSYLQDPSLPAGWRCQIIESSVYFFSPVGERFTSREGVAERMKSDPAYTEQDIDKLFAAAKRRKPAPKSILISRGQYTEKESDNQPDSDNITRLPNGLFYRMGGENDGHLDLDKLFDETNGGMIDLVQLPEVFLNHPTVIVEEKDNEMTIKDVDTKDFIAKKIIYE